MKVVGFDLDDTLVPEVLFLKSGIRHIAEWLHFKYPQIDRHQVIRCMDIAVMTRCNHYSSLECFLASEGLDKIVDMKETVAEFRSHLPDPSIYHLPPSIESILTKLKEEGVKIVLITDGRSRTQRNKIKTAGLDRFFEDTDILISEETGHDKTHPDNFIHIMEKYPGATEFHYVGDNPAKDVIHPSRLGWITHLVHPFPLAVHQGIPR